MFDEGDDVLIPRGLIGAACGVIERGMDAPKTLAELRRYTFGDLSAAAPAAERQGRSAEEAAAEQTPQTRWAWWFEDDETCHIEATESDCHGAAQDRIDSDTEPGIECEYLIARTAHPLDAIAHDKLAHRLGEFIHEDIEERCADETAAEVESLSITDDETTELGQLVLGFLRARAKVQWWGIDKKTETRHTYVAGSDDETVAGAK